MNNEPKKQFTLENAHLFWLNFSGREDQYNEAGKKTFCVHLTDEMADKLVEDGWNVKYTSAKDEGDPDEPFISVHARYDKYPPKIVLITDDGKRTMLDEKTVEILDWANIKQADLMVNGRDWFVNGKGGVKAYLRSLFVTIEEDFLEKKYAVPEPE